MIDGDRDRLAQVIGNLLSNAIKYSPAGGAVRVHVELEGDRAVLMVNDQGIGIDGRGPRARLREVLPQLRAVGADRGHRPRASRSRARSSRRTAATIGVQSEPGAGSTFWIELPLKRTAATVPLDLGAAGRPRRAPRRRDDALDRLPQRAGHLAVAALEPPPRGRRLAAPRAAGR